MQPFRPLRLEFLLPADPMNSPNPTMEEAEVELDQAKEVLVLWAVESCLEALVQAGLIIVLCQDDERQYLALSNTK